MEYAGLTLDPFQEQALAAIDRGHSVLVAAPTGAGKTLIAEYAIDQALARGRQIVYTAPIKALSNQKFRDFAVKYPNQVGILTGDVSLNYGAPGLIMTTEIFRNTLLEDPDRLSSIDYVIFDEFHYIDDRERGTAWEESVMFAPPNVRFVCLSATMPNVAELAGWMEEASGAPVEVVEESHRPVPLDHRLWADGHGVHSLAETEVLLRRLSRGRGPQPRRGLDAEALLDTIEAEGKLPCLYFSFNRRLCAARAEENASRDLLTRPEQKRVARLFAELCERFGVTGEPSAVHMGELVQRGVAYHHAGILPTLKEVIERLFTSGLIKMLFATETFALGVNMPAQTVVLDSLEKYHGTHFGPLTCRGYQQMAGRAGRRGMDTQGYVYARVNPRETSPDAIRQVVAGEPEPVNSRFNLGYSSVLSLYDRWGERLFRVCDASLAAYQHRQRARKGSRAHPGLRKLVRKRLQVLKELSYIGKHGLTKKGRFALHIPGYELQVTELYWSGLLSDLTAYEICMLVNALVHEARRGERRGPPPKKLLARVRKRARKAMRKVYFIEKGLDIPDPVRKLDFNLATAVNEWSRGALFGDLAKYTLAAEGDIIRSFRMTIQILRQLRKATDDDDLAQKLRDAEDAINRDAVDAERQLRAGCE
ncbi:DEAD/DEAH box helicase [bacterium]|nr:DEAD/DEAH box helicase [bacterium]